MEYLDFADVFFPKLALELFEYIEINDYAIELVDDWQSPYRHIYSLRLVKLEILKTYIKTNLANTFIRSSKFLVKALIFFNKKIDKNFWFYVDC